MIAPNYYFVHTKTSENKQAITETEINYLFSLAGGLSYSGGTRNSATNSQLKKFATLLLESRNNSNDASCHPLTDEQIDNLLRSTLMPNASHASEPGEYSYAQIVQIIRAVEQRHNIKENKS